MAFMSLRMNPAVMSIMRTLLYGGMAVFPLLLLEYSLLDELSDRFIRVQQNEAYDFIVVGAGTTGSLVASRLAEDYKVLLLEAGGDPNPLQSIPAVGGLFLNSRHDWKFYTVPQQHSCFSLNNQASLWPRGRGLGGTSNLNFMAYIRGHPFDYDNWAQMVGDDRWNYQNFIPFFKRSENYNEPDDNEFHGHGGPVNVEPDTWNPLARYFIEAAQEMGYPRVDLNSPFDEGFSNFVFTKRNGARWGAYQAFLRPNRRSHRLTVRKYSLVTKVLLKGSNNFAYGVEYVHHGARYIAHSNKEVILSAGAVQSPQILMLSGIGPEKHLLSLGMNPLVNLPGVGQNLQDHIIGFTGPFTVEQPLTFLLDRDSSPSSLLQYLQSGRGPLSASGVLGTGFIATNFSKQASNPPGTIWPDLQLLLFGLPVHEQGPTLLGQLFNLRSDISEKFYRPVAGRDSFHIMSIVSRPKSRGQILLASNDPKDRPLINPNYLSEIDDIAIISEGMQKAIHMVENTAAFQSIGAKLSQVPFPSCEHIEFRSTAYFECFIRHFTLSVYHPCCSNAMGKVDHPTSVVDSTLKVIGVERLRVIDASVMPQIISSNIQSACFAIGERGAEFIKEEWRSRKSG